MKVGINISSLHHFNKGRGIGFYTENLITSLKEYTNVEVVVIESSDIKEKVDLIHYPFFDFFRPTLKIEKNIPTVVTIHDAIPLLFPKLYPPGIKGRINLFRQKQALKKVKAVITDSISSTNDVIKIFDLPEEKVSTIYLAPAGYFRKLTKNEIEIRISRFNLPEKFVLYSGGVNWNKNLSGQTNGAIMAGTDIVFVGKGFETRDNLDHPELKEFKGFVKLYKNHPNVHILGFVSNEELVALMNAARALLYVSHYEGFGLPILEAQSCGTPVITGDNSSMKEVVGKNGLNVRPMEDPDIAKMINMLEDQSLRNRIIQQGFENLKRFSWKKTAQDTALIYQKCI